MNIRIALYQLCGLKHADGIVGKTQIAGKAYHKPGATQATIAVIDLNRPNSRFQRGPIRNKPDLVARYSAVTQEKSFRVTPDDDDGIQRAKHQRVCSTDCFG